MLNFSNHESTINDNTLEDEKYFSELNIDSDIVSEEIEETPETNRLESFLEEQAPSEECTALVTVNERRLMAAQTMFKKSIKVSIKSFLISLSLSFLNLFI